MHGKRLAMKWIKMKIWLIRYTFEIRRLTGLSFRESWGHGKASIENLNYDLEDMDCPIYMVGEDLSLWSD